MNKKELLEDLIQKVDSGEISREEVLDILSLDTATSSNMGSRVTKALYVLGGLVVVVGLILLVSQIWNQIGSFGRVGVTFGIGALFNLLGLFLMREKPAKMLGGIYSAIGGVMIPFGIFVLIQEFEAGNQLRIFSFAAICLSYVLFSRTFKHFVLTFFAIVNATIALYLSLYEVNNGLFNGMFTLDKSYNYLTLLIGISYILLSTVFARDWNAKLVKVLHFAGMAGILGAGFSLVFGSITWQILFTVLLMLSFVLSIHLRSTIILIMANIFLVFHISYISAEYFANSVIGWPLTLVVLGLAFIGLGYGSVFINKKYIKN